MYVSHSRASPTHASLVSHKDTALWHEHIAAAKFSLDFQQVSQEFAIENVGICANIFAHAAGI